MKAIVALFISIGGFSCAAEKEMQMKLVDVELVKIDTLKSYYEPLKKALTWRSEHLIDYVTYEPLSHHYVVGERMRVMVKR